MVCLEPGLYRVPDHRACPVRDRYVWRSLVEWKNGRLRVRIGWPAIFFDRFFPVLGKDFGVGALGVMQCLYVVARR